MGLSLPQLGIVSFTGALAFGLYLTTHLICLRWLLFVNEGWEFKKSTRWGIVFITFLIFACNWFICP